MLRKIRICLAAVFWTAITLLFLDFTGTLHAWLGWMAKIQLLPAVLALNLAVIVFLILLTLVFGRIYCSVICPLGVFQDIVSWFRGHRKKKERMRFNWKPAKNVLRYCVLAAFIAVLALGFTSAASIIAPYSAWGRIVGDLLAPLYKLGNNALAFICERVDSYAFYSKEVWIKSMPTFAISLVTLAAIVIFAWKGGREYCNTICPVGSILSVISRFSLFGPVFDTDKCRDCGLCERSCKASCLNAEEHRIDSSRCVDCMNCISVCRHGAIRYGFRYAKAGAHKSDGSNAGRRAFMTGAVLAAGSAALKAQEMKVDGGLADIAPKKAPKREIPVVPAGASGVKHFYQHCISCQLCVSACPEDVLRPSMALNHLMQPELSFEKGWCRPECNICSQVCPAGAIAGILPEEKTAIQIGHAVVSPDACISATGEVNCGNCARHCPTGAIRMVRKDKDDRKSPMVPAVDASRCTGCGSCENHCPVRPVSAIHVEGNSVHTIK